MLVGKVSWSSRQTCWKRSYSPKQCEVFWLFWLNVLSLTGREPSLRYMFSKIGREIILLHGLLNKMETEVEEQEKLKNSLKVIFFFLFVKY
uniref:Uncharacterized protein n=1 Tax=Falco tinnunculus TaxID=100819 RepID=A0A8C4UKV4_FALTI